MSLHQAMPLVGFAVWEAISHPVELVSLAAGAPAATVFALSPAQKLTGTPWAENIYPPDRKRVLNFLNGARAIDKSSSIDYRLIVAEGELLWIRHLLVSRGPARGHRTRLRGLLIAIPEQKHLEWQCLHVSERECHRIGQELHDDLCQVLTGLTCMIRKIGQRADELAPAVAEELAGLGRDLQGATLRVRSMAHGLFPAQLDYFTLRQALNEFVRQTKIRFPVKLRVGFSGKLPPHTSEQILHVYRIVQEAVGNALRHGKATVIRIFVAADAAGIQVRIEDNGSGFPELAIRPEGIGLHVMKYRTRMLGGEFRFRNLSPRGALVEFKYPFEAGTVLPAKTKSLL
jgi:signal transduction histidine kinase